MICACLSGSIILIMPLIFLPALVISKQAREHDNAIRTIAQSLKPTVDFCAGLSECALCRRPFGHQSEKEIDGVNYYHYQMV